MACCQFGQTPCNLGSMGHEKSCLKSCSALHTEAVGSGPIKTEHDVLLVEKGIKGVVCMECLKFRHNEAVGYVSYAPPRPGFVHTICIITNVVFRCCDAVGTRDANRECRK